MSKSSFHRSFLTGGRSPQWKVLSLFGLPAFCRGSFRLRLQSLPSILLGFAETWWDLTTGLMFPLAHNAQTWWHPTISQGSVWRAISSHFAFWTPVPLISAGGVSVMSLTTLVWHTLRLGRHQLPKGFVLLGRIMIQTCMDRTFPLGHPLEDFLHYWQVPELPDAPDVLFHLEVFPGHGSRFGVGRDAAMLSPVGILHPDNLFQVVFQVGRLGKSVSHRLKGRDSVSSQDQKVWFMDFKADCRSSEGNARLCIRHDDPKAVWKEGGGGHFPLGPEKAEPLTSVHASLLGANLSAQTKESGLSGSIPLASWIVTRNQDCMATWLQKISDTLINFIDPSTERH